MRKLPSQPSLMEQALLAVIGDAKVAAYLGEWNRAALKQAVNAIREESGALPDQIQDLIQHATDVIGHFEKYEKMNAWACAQVKKRADVLRSSDVEIDENPSTSRSDHNDGGCYVQLWKWIRDPECPNCAGGEKVVPGMASSSAAFRCESCGQVWPCPKCGTVVAEHIIDCDDINANCDRQEGKPKSYHCLSCGHSWPYEVQT